MPTDFYKTLGVTETASADEIKKAYRKLAREYHPDRNPDKPEAEERFKEIQEAYDTLSDTEKRKQYDTMRKNPFGPFGNGYRTSSGNRYQRRPDGSYVRVDDAFTGFGREAGDEGVGFGDLFSRFFSGEEPRRREPARGRDVETTLRISFDKALRGGKTTVTLPDGDKVRLTIPEGVDAGFKIRLRGRGEDGPTGQRGDLYVTFDVQPHPRFERDGRDLTTTETINVFEAMLGTERTLTNPYGKQIKLAIPAGTQPGEKFRLRGQGVKTDDGTGDLFVAVEVTVPKTLSDEDRRQVRLTGERLGLITP